MPRLIKPRALRPGARLGIAAPGFGVDRAKLEAGERVLRSAGFETWRREDIFDREVYYAGSDQRRAAEFMELVEDPTIDGIVCARGGYGCDRIIPALDAEAVRRAAKPLIGYSDVTALLLWQRRHAGLMGFHGPMLEDDPNTQAWQHLIGLVTRQAVKPVRLRGCGVAGGRATARLTGGSLTLLAASIGSSWEVQTRGAILMLEDVGERPYRIDRMLAQLRAAGKFENLAGVGVGAFAECVDEKYPEANVESVIADFFGSLGIPLVVDLPFGHVDANYAWALGARATLDAESGELVLNEWGVDPS